MVKSNRADLAEALLGEVMAGEYLGTLLLVLVACGSCLVPDADLVSVSLCFGLSVATLVWVTCRLSGGHINPAVTVGMLVARRFTVARTLLYLLSQSAGALTGAAVLLLLIPNELVGNLGTPVPAEGVSELQALGVELVISYVLVLAVFACCDGGRQDINKASIPLTIGLAVSMCHFFAVPLTGAGMNPARVLGPAVLSHTWTSHWLYWVGPLIGGATAGLTYDLLFASNSSSAKIRGFLDSNYDNDNYTGQEVKYKKEEIKMARFTS